MECKTVGGKTRRIGEGEFALKNKWVKNLKILKMHWEVIYSWMQRKTR